MILRRKVFKFSSVKIYTNVYHLHLFQVEPNGHKYCTTAAIIPTDDMLFFLLLFRQMFLIKYWHGIISIVMFLVTLSFMVNKLVSIIPQVFALGAC